MQKKCGKSPKTLHHVLNNCQTSLNQDLYTWRHNNVLKVLFEAIAQNLESNWKVNADLESCSSDNGTIPSDILITTLRPDMCATNIQEKKINLIELTISWDSSYEQAKTRKEERYTPLIAELAELGWQANLIIQLKNARKN